MTSFADGSHLEELVYEHEDHLFCEEATVLVGHPYINGIEGCLFAGFLQPSQNEASQGLLQVFDFIVNTLCILLQLTEESFALQLLDTLKNQILRLLRWLCRKLQIILRLLE